MKNLIAAIQFITIFPLGKNSEYNPMGMLPYYPLVGLIIGGLLVGFDFLACLLWMPSVAAVADLVFLIIVTGAFHLDGLADASDGLFSHRPREKQLEIMKDSRIGVMGLAAVICCAGIKWGGLTSLPSASYERMLLLLIIPSYARGAMLFGIRFLEYGRDSGTGKDHFIQKITPGAFIWLVPAVILSLALGIRGIWLNLCFLLLVFLIIWLYKKKIGCITGDMIGAMAESVEALLFLFAAIRLF